MRSILSYKKLVSIFIAIIVLSGCAKQTSRSGELIIRETPPSGISTDQKNFQKIRTIKAYADVETTYKGRTNKLKAAIVADVKRDAIAIQLIDTLAGSVAEYTFITNSPEMELTKAFGLPFTTSDLIKVLSGYAPCACSYSGKGNVIVDLAGVKRISGIKYPSEITVEVEKKHLSFKLVYNDIEFNKKIDEKIFK